MTSLDETTDAILDFIVDLFPPPTTVAEMGIPTAETVLRNSAGQINPVVAVQFGDVIPEGAKNMATPRGDDYHLPVYIQIVAHDAKTARRGYTRLLDAFLGESFPYSGSIRKRVGGGMFTLNATNGATEAYMYPASFKLLIQLVDGV